jgi:S-adenosylmethionine synthetase
MKIYIQVNHDISFLNFLINNNLLLNNFNLFLNLKNSEKIFYDFLIKFFEKKNYNKIEIKKHLYSLNGTKNYIRRNIIKMDEEYDAFKKNRLNPISVCKIKLRVAYSNFFITVTNDNDEVITFASLGIVNPLINNKRKKMSVFSVTSMVRKVVYDLNRSVYRFN